MIFYISDIEFGGNLGILSFFMLIGVS